MDPEGRVLTPDERARLATEPETALDRVRLDGETFEALASRGTRWAFVTVTDTSLPDVVVIGSVWDHVTVDRSDLSGGSFTDTLFRDCVFRDVVLDRVQFVRCRFDRCLFEGIQGSNGSFAAVEMAETRIVDCRFDELSIAGLTATACQFEATQFDRTLEGSSLTLAGSRVSQCRWTGGAYSALALTDCRTANSLFSWVTIDQLSFAAGSLNEVLFANCRVGTWLIQSPSEDCAINCCGVEALSVVETKATRLSILDSTVDVLSLLKSTVDSSYWLSNRVPTEMKVEGTTLDSLTLRQGSYRIRFIDSDLRGRFQADDLSVEILGEDARLAPGAEMLLQGVTYQGPGRLPQRPR